MIDVREPSLAPTVEFRPNILDRTAGLIGKILTTKSGVTEYSIPDGYTLDALLDHYDEQPQSLDIWADFDKRGDPDHDASPILGLLRATPELKRPLYLPRTEAEDSRTVCTITVGSEWAFLPVRNFVSAPGFNDWNSGRNGDRGSRKVIRSKARDTDPIEAIDMVSANVQPNGLVLYRLIRDGAHRLAAAHLRNDKEIAVKQKIYINRLSKDLISLSECE